MAARRLARQQAELQLQRALLQEQEELGGEWAVPMVQRAVSWGLEELLLVRP